jgi:hypothetical protein
MANESYKLSYWGSGVFDNNISWGKSYYDFALINVIYSASNLYTEASAVNADNEAATLGSWVAFNGPHETFVAVTNDGPTGVTSHSFHFVDIDGHPYRGLRYPFTGLTIGATYRVRFWYKSVTGSGTFRMQLDGEGSILVDSNYTGIWKRYAGGTFTPAATSGNLDFVPSWNSGAADIDFNIAAFEIIAV